MNAQNPSVLLDKKKFEYFSNWYNPVIRELITMKWLKTPDQISEYIKPKLSAYKIGKSLKLLQDLKLIKKLGKGTYVQTDKHLTTGNEILSNAVMEYQHQHLKLASEIMDMELGELEPEYTSICGSISENTFKEIKQRIQRFRKKIIKMIGEDSNETGVCQLNFQFYPVSELPKSNVEKYH